VRRQKVPIPSRKRQSPATGDLLSSPCLKAGVSRSFR
jgi:hypothetical protein